MISPSVREDQERRAVDIEADEESLARPSGSSESSTAVSLLGTSCNEDLNELVEWLNSADLVPNSTVIMSLAKALKVLIDTMMSGLRSELNCLNERDHIKSNLFTKQPSQCSKEKFLHKLYLNPYFRDRRLFIPVPNVDTRKRRKLCLPSMLTTTLMKWSDQEVLLLSYAVRESIKCALANKLTEEYNNMVADLQLLKKSSEENEQLEEAVKSSEQALSEFRKQLEDPEWQEKIIEETYNDAAFASSIEWDQVAETVKNGQTKRYPNERTEAECRSAWLYAYAPWINKGDWSKKEVEDLLSIAEEHKFTNWIAIAEKLGTGRTAFACVQKYVQERDDKNGKGSCWTPEEDEKLLEVAKIYTRGDHVLWRPVAFNFEKRDATQCRQRYEALNVRRGHWTEEEDRLLLQAVKRHGRKSWAAIAVHVPDRSAVQCRARYMDVLDKGVKLSSWTKLEDEILMLGFETFGRCWTKISNLIVGRTGNQVKMRFRALERIKRNLYSDSYELQLLAKDRAGKLKRQRRAAMRRELLSDSSEEESKEEVPSLSSLQDFLSTLDESERKAIELGLSKIKDRYIDKERKSQRNTKSEA
ncbi:hypothetical protein M514_05501 [Trichuris suis]|uniref:Myb-like DNA-binding domain protein n=1 Tax=Trichuris suis TaxID=68888 RepID=A0A085N012_9BILA|nr:hypothetical protein M513_05501 [Trichuris suis]KFD62808.1 hypothetical protein M514_05501 [Trichuris suis]KHJ47006.1 Myb-like DNA-binding domain protein [Trichuris suis]